MKSNHWLWCGLVGLTAATVLAQNPAPAPAKPKAGAAYAKDMVLDPPGTATVKNESLNVRDEPALTADVVAHLNRKESVTVFEEMTLNKPKTGEPAGWSRISLPTNAAAWVFADYVDSKTMKVTRRLNVRGGPGENFKSLVLLDKGTPVTEVKRAQGWTQILPPPNAFGFVATEYLVMEPAAAPAIVAQPVVVPPPAMVAVPEPAVVTPAAPTNADTPTNATPPAEAATPIVAPEPVAAQPVVPPPAATPVVVPTPAPATAGDDVTLRIVTREGFIHKALNIQAPTDYELMDVHSGELMEYLQPPPTGKAFKNYLGAHVTVTGPEMLDSRWPKTPVLQVQTVDLMP